MIFRDHTHSRCRFRCSGPDALRYLNGQISQDLRHVSPTRSLPSCVTNAKGRLEAVVRLSTDGQAFWVDAPVALRDFLALRLEKYLIADDCIIEDETENTAQIFTNSPPPINPGYWVTSSDHGIPGWEIILKRENAPALLDALKSSGASEPDAVAWNDTRIRCGIPVWGCELDADTLPPEAGLESTHIDYHKGCYIGQEVISRLKSVGQVTRRLCLVESAAGPLTPGWELFPADTDSAAPARPIGRLTSVTSDGRHGLAYLRRPHQEAGTRIHALPNDRSGVSIPGIVQPAAITPPITP
ncbi:MAG: YgfZ/GcvT domain-containing protein [Verrucomicrobiales bacterium]